MAVQAEAVALGPGGGSRAKQTDLCSGERAGRTCWFIGHLSEAKRREG